MVHAVHGEGGNHKCSGGGALCVWRVAAAAVSAGESLIAGLFLQYFLGRTRLHLTQHFVTGS